MNGTILSIFRAFCAIITGIIFSANAATIIPSGMTPQGFKVRVLNNFEPGLALQASPDLRTWSTVQANLGLGLEVVVTDAGANQQRARFYRLSNQILQPPVQLPDLGLLPNKVFTAGDGADSIQFAPSGALGYVVWRNQDLVYRERNTGGGWTEAVVFNSGRSFSPGSREEYRFQLPAALAFGSDSRPHIIRGAGGSSFVVHTRGANGQWSQQTINANGASGNFALFSAVMGAGDKWHVAFVNESENPQVVYGSNKSGSWQWVNVVQLNGRPRGFLGQSYSPRYFNVAVDAANKAHIVYTPKLEITYPLDYAKPYSELAYATDVSGSWRTEIVMRPPDWSGDAGTGASIAIDRNNQPVIASWFVNRADTGSSQESYLYYHTRVNGSWTKSQVTRTPSNYAAGDGPKGTGFAPQLRFDGNGNPHILFLDHAAEHFNNSGQNEYAGNLRLARWDGAQWSIRTLVTQTHPLTQQIVYPSFALRGSEVAYVGLERATVWGPDAWPRTVASTYKFMFGTTQTQ